MSPRTVSLLALAALLLACGAPRPSPTVRLPRGAPEPLLIRNVSVLDVASGTRLAARDVLLADGRIAAIGPSGSVDGPEDVRTLDGAGGTLVPGLVDMHGHVDTDPGPVWESRFPDHAAVLAAYLYCGVTALLDPHDASSDAFERRDRVARGALPGPRIQTSGSLLTAPDGHPIALVKELAPWWIGWYVAPRVATAVESAEAGEAAVDALAAKGADVVKIVIDAIPLDAPRMSRALASAIVRRAASHGLRVVAHVGTTEDAVDAAEAGVAAWMHAVYKERIPDARIAQLVGYGIPVVATLEVFDRYARADAGPRVATKLEREIAPASVLASFYPQPDDFDAGSLQSWLDLVTRQRGVGIDNVRRLHRAGMTILAGSDSQSGVFPGAGLHRELHHLVSAGLSPVEAIRAATLDAARFLAGGAEPDFGSIAVGKRADLLLVEGDPSRDVGALENIREVLLAGVPLERVPVPSDAAG